MKNLIEIEGRYFKECNVILIITNEEPNIGDICVSTRYKDKYLIFGSFENSYTNECKKAELYITSDDEIKEGDYCIDDTGLFGSYEKSDTILNGKKIIATTDKSLEIHITKGKGVLVDNLLQPPQGFIKEYCNNPVDKILVEVEYLSSVGFIVQDIFNNSIDFDSVEIKGLDIDLKIKTDSNNNIYISSLINKYPKMYSEEELETILLNYRNVLLDSFLSKDQTIKWFNNIKTNNNETN